MREILLTYRYIVHNSIFSQEFESMADLFLKHMTRQIPKSKSFLVGYIVLQGFDPFNW